MSFGSSIQDVFIAPEALDALPIGEPVSIPRLFYIQFHCRVGGGYTDFTVSTLAVPEAYPVPGQTDMFTTPQLASLGLGYKAWWTIQGISNCGGTCWYSTQSLTSVTTQTIPPGPEHQHAGWYIWLSELSIPPRWKTHAVQGGIQFYKIGPIQDTGGVTLPASLTTNLMNFYVTEATSPSVVHASYLFSWTMNTFVSKVRACTPNLDRTVNFGESLMSGSPAQGQMLSSQNFTLIFTCPYLAYSQIGYSFKPKFGAITPTLMKLDPSSSAKGVAIRIQRLAPSPTSITWDHTYAMSEFTLPSTPINNGWVFPGPNNPASVFQDWQNVHANPSPPPWGPRGGALTEERNHTATFRAQLVRQGPDPLTPGTVKSVVWIYLQYK